MKLLTIVFSLFVMACTTTSHVSRSVVVPRRSDTIEVRSTFGDVTVSELITRCAMFDDECYRLVYGQGYALASRRGRPNGHAGECVSVSMEFSAFKDEVIAQLVKQEFKGRGRELASHVIPIIIDEMFTCQLKEPARQGEIDVDVSVARFIDSCDAASMTCESTFFYVTSKLYDAAKANPKVFWSTMQNFCPKRSGELDLKGLFMSSIVTQRVKAKSEPNHADSSLLEALISDALFYNRCTLTEPPVFIGDAESLFQR